MRAGFVEWRRNLEWNEIGFVLFFTLVVGLPALVLVLALLGQEDILPGWVLTLVDIVIGVGSPAEGCDPQGDPSRC